MYLQVDVMLLCHILQIRHYISTIFMISSELGLTALQENFVVSSQPLTVIEQTRELGAKPMNFPKGQTSSFTSNPT